MNDVPYKINIVLRLILLIVVAAFMISIGLIHNGIDNMFGTAWWRNPL